MATILLDATPPAVPLLLGGFDNPIPGRSVDATVSPAGAADELFPVRTDDQGEAQLALPALDTPGGRHLLSEQGRRRT